MQYMNLFNTVEEYNEKRYNGYIQPWLSLIEENKRVNYNRKDIVKEPVCWYNIAKSFPSTSSLAKNGIVPDLSGNGHDLTLETGFASCAISNNSTLGRVIYLNWAYNPNRYSILVSSGMPALNDFTVLFKHQCTINAQSSRYCPLVAYGTDSYHAGIFWLDEHFTGGTIHARVFSSAGNATAGKVVTSYYTTTGISKLTPKTYNGQTIYSTPPPIVFNRQQL